MKSMRSSRAKKPKKEIEELRTMAFGAPEHSLFRGAEYLEIEQESIVRPRVLLDYVMIEEATAIIAREGSDPRGSRS